MSSPLVLQMLHCVTKYDRYRGHFELARYCVAVAKRVKYSTRWWKRFIVAFVGRQR